MSKKIILALDTDNLETAHDWVAATKESIAFYKIGLEFFLKFGSTGLLEIKNRHGVELFLDLKLHDIPNTVKAATKSVAFLKPKFLTVHASGGRAMVRSAVDVDPDISITAVTILTSLDSNDVVEVGFAKSPLDTAVGLAKVAVAAGATSIVCSPFEVNAIRAAVGPNVILITPGVRPAGADLGDQKRVMTPQEALAAGANYLVIGRPITEHAKKSLEEMKLVAAQISQSL